MDKKNPPHWNMTATFILLLHISEVKAQGRRKSMSASDNNEANEKINFSFHLS